MIVLSRDGSWARRVRPMAAAVLALACLGATPERPAPAIETVPAPARAYLHPTTTALPPFPHEDRALLDPAQWGPGIRGEGRICALELRSYDRGVPVSLPSVGSRKPGRPLSARYLCAERAWRGPRYAGPFYVWNGDGSLIERSYRTTDGTRYREVLYQYRGNGLVWAYRRRERNEDRTGPLLLVDEYYGPDGRIIGFSVDRSGGPDGDSLAVRWTSGTLVSDAAFRKWAAEFPAN